MSKYELDKLIQLWETERITHEQGTGQTLQHVKAHNGRIGELERLVMELERRILDLQKRTEKLERQIR